MIRILIGFLLLGSYIYGDETMIEEHIGKSLEFWNVPGASVAIVKGDEIVLAKGFGYTNLQKNRPVDAETLFPIASLTKSFSSVAAGIFAEQQQIDWDHSIQSLWPAFRLPDEYATNHLTIRDCLSMRAGLVGQPLEDSFWDQAHLTEKMLLDTLSQFKFPYGFRGSFVYQNLLHNIISHVIEEKSGKSWELFVKENLLNPLEMNATTVSHGAFLEVQNKAFPHQWKGDTITEVPFERLDVIVAAAGLSSNASDMAKWLKFLLNRSPVVVDTLTPQTPVKAEMFFAKDEVWMEKIFFPNAKSVSYGMGWFIHDYKDVMICQDPGLIDGMNGLMAVIPELDLGIVILNNLEAPFFSHSVLFHIVGHYRNEKTDWDPILLNIRKSHG